MLRNAPRLLLLRAAVAAAALVAVPASAGVVAPLTIPALASTTSTPTDASLTARLQAGADDARLAAGRETLYARGTYLTHAGRVTSALVAGQAVTQSPDRAPLSYLGGTSSPDLYESQVDGAIDAVLSASHDVLAYPLHTDGGWSVRSVRLADGRIRWGVALVVGWPDPAMTSNTGCATGGYCWATRGLNPHLPWTRNTVNWYLSTANLPSNGESLMRSAVAALNRTSGLGADLVYAGLTSATAPTASQRFVVVWGSGCTSSTALACTYTGTQGSYDLIYQARVVMTRGKYDRNPNSTLWIGTLIHEMSHGLGLGHYDSAYGGTYQNMRWANGPNAVMAGDGNGLRGIAPGGRVYARLHGARTLSGFRLVVTTANSGFGGIRSITTQCLDSDGVWQNVSSTVGRLDGRPADRTVGSINLLIGQSRSCRAVVKSKTATVTSPTVTLTA
ncbi:MAG TPA: hypothetical protein VF519_18345 [Mycobacteriales bacterium]